MSLEVDLIINVDEDFNQLIPFLNYVVKECQRYFKSKYDARKVKRLEDYINNNSLFQQSKLYNFSNKRRYFNVTSIAQAAMNNLKYRQTVGNGHYHIYIDSTVNVANFEAKIITIVKMIEYGTLATPAYPIFGETFKYIETNAQTIFDRYLLLGGV